MRWNDYVNPEESIQLKNNAKNTLFDGYAFKIEKAGNVKVKVSSTQMDFVMPLKVKEIET